MEELTIETLPVEIHVIRVGGHKMTASVFEQIPFWSFPCDVCGYGDYQTFCALIEGLVTEIRARSMLPNSFKVLGYVQREHKWLVLTDPKGVLRKAEIYFPSNKQYESAISAFNKELEESFPQLYIAT